MFFNEIGDTPMAHPYYHAVSSARRFGGDAADYLAAHEFMDHTKAHLADCRHRLFLHNTWGVFFSEKILGTTFSRLSDHKIMPLRPILEQHIVEDFGFIPSLKHCLDSLAPEPLLNDDDDTFVHSQQSSISFGGAARDYLFIHRALNAPRDVLADRRSQRVLHNSWGITLLLRLLGDTCKRPSDGSTISIRPILEDHIRCDLGYIPTLEESVSEIAIEAWMYRSTLPLSQSPSQ